MNWLDYEINGMIMDYYMIVTMGTTNMLRLHDELIKYCECNLYVNDWTWRYTGFTKGDPYPSDRPMHVGQHCTGAKIYFKNEEDQIEFKLRFL